MEMKKQKGTQGKLMIGRQLKTKEKKRKETEQHRQRYL